jgi:hypothetical protein
MLPTLLLAATLALAPEHRVADLRTGATRDDESVLAIDNNRVITFAAKPRALRAVPLDDASKATTLAGDVSRAPVAAPPLIAWTSGEQTHIAPIDAPGAGTVFPRSDVHTMKCNETACLASMGDELLVIGNARPIAHVTPGGFVLGADPGGFLVARFETPFLLRRIDNSGDVTFTSTAVQATSFNLAADFDGDRYALVWYQVPSLRAQSVGLRGDVSEPLDIAAIPDVLTGIAVTYAAGRHLVAFTYPDGHTSILAPGAIDPARLHAIRLDGALRPIDPAPFIVDATPFADLNPLVTPRDGGFLVAWSHSPNVIISSDPEGAQVDAEGRVGPRMLLSAGFVPQVVSSAATIPGALLVAWLEYPHQDGASTLRLRRFGPDGAPLEAPITVADADARMSAMAARGSDALIVWGKADFKLRAAILHPDGTLQSVPLADLSGMPSVAASRNGWMIAVAEDEGVTTIRVDDRGIASPPQTLVALRYSFPYAAVASDGERFLVVWSTPAGTGSTTCNFVPCGTRAELLDATGGVLAGGIQLAPGHAPPSAAFAGGEYFVAAGSSAVRLNRDGLRIADAQGGLSHVAPFGNAVLASFITNEGIHLVVIDHGVRSAERLVAPVFDYADELTEGAVVYDILVGGEQAVAFRQILTERHRSAYH